MTPFYFKEHNNMPKTGQNIEIEQEDSKIIQVTVYDQSNSILDLSGYTVLWKVFKNKDSIMLTKTIGNGITLTNPTEGVFEILVSSIDTQNLLGKYFHSCKIIDGLGNTSKIFSGYFNVSANI
jgi:hypothetical protein